MSVGLATIGYAPIARAIGAFGPITTGGPVASEPAVGDLLLEDGTDLLNEDGTVLQGET